MFCTYSIYRLEHARNNKTPRSSIDWVNWESLRATVRLHDACRYRSKNRCARSAAISDRAILIYMRYRGDVPLDVEKRKSALLA